MQKIIITGSKGIIGTVLTKGLQDEYEITGLDLPETNLNDIHTITDVAEGHSALIHLAWNTKDENFGSGKINLENQQMFFNAYQAALDRGIKRIIVASSVHADRFTTYEGTRLLSPDECPSPNSPYGATKVGMEAMGKYFAKKGLEVVCVRFGGVSADNNPYKGDRDDLVYFHQEDCVSLIKAILSAEIIPDNYLVLYGMSDNKGRIHDISNPIGWVPKHGLK